MSDARGTSRLLPSWLAVLALLPSCTTLPDPVSITPESSLLAVDVVFPVPLGRDPGLVQAFFVKGPIHAGLEKLPELVRASFVKSSRAYLLDPEPGTYSLVAVTSAVAAPKDPYPVAGGVEKSTLPGTLGNAIIFPADLIQRTRTTIGAGGVAFMGALRIAPGDRIEAEAEYQDRLQGQLAEAVHPGSTSRSGLASWFSRTWRVDLEETSLRRGVEERRAFLEAAARDLGESPWARVVARASAPEPRAGTPEPRAAPPEPRVAIPEPRAAPPEPRVAVREPEAAPPSERELGTTRPEVVTPEPAPEPTPPPPERRPIPGLPPDSPLARIEYGMRFDEVIEILGEPDDRYDHVTARAWIPFYTGPGAYLRDFVYEGVGRVVFSIHDGSLEVIDAVHDPNEGS